MRLCWRAVHVYTYIVFSRKPSFYALRDDDGLDERSRGEDLASPAKVGEGGVAICDGHNLAFFDGRACIRYAHCTAYRTAVGGQGRGVQTELLNCRWGAGPGR